MGDLKRKRGRKPKNSVAENTNTTTPSTAVDEGGGPINPVPEAANQEPSTRRRGRGRPKKRVEEPNNDIGVSPERRGSRLGDHSSNGGGDLPAVGAVSSGDARHAAEVAQAAAKAVKVVPSMDAVVKVFCVHTEPNFSLPWQRKRQYSSSSSGFIIGGRRVLTNAHSVEYHTQVKLKKRGSDTKYLATVLAIGNECDIGKFYLV